MAASGDFAPDIQDYMRKEREDDEKAMADKGGIYLFSRRFDRLTAGWSWVREDPNYIALVHERTLRIQTQPGHLWGTKTNDVKNIIIHPVPTQPSSPEACCITQVTVRNQITESGEQAGLIWYYDDNNYIKLVREFLKDVRWLVFAREQNGEPAVIAKIQCTSDSAMLRLSLNKDQQVVAEARSGVDEKTSYQSLGTCAPIDSKLPLHVGLMANGAAPDSTHYAFFSDFVHFYRVQGPEDPDKKKKKKGGGY